MSTHAPSRPPRRREPTGIDYLGLIQKRREQELQQRIDYRHLPGPGGAAANDQNDSKEMTK